MALKNLIGMQFNRLTVIERAENDSNGNARWLCECNCEHHNRKIVLGFALRNKTVQSCGCLRKEKGSRHDLTNMQFGKLIAKTPTKQRTKTGSIIWECECECGNKTLASVVDLNRKHKISCGCITSQGEYLIMNFLNVHNIPFIKEYVNTDCRNETGGQLRFDFAILNSNTKEIDFLIEYDGEQHYQEVSRFQGSLEERQCNDKVKDDWCKANYLSLLRIPYWDRDNIESILLLKTGRIK